MEVDSAGYASNTEGSAQDFVAEVLEAISDRNCWYGDEQKATDLANQVLQLVSSSPGQVYVVCQKLAEALLQGASAPEASALTLCGKSWPSRSELNAECRAMLRRAVPGEHILLEGEDALLIRELLAFNPSGDFGVRNCKGIAIGMHPTFGKPCFFVVREKKKPKDFSYARCVDNFHTLEVKCQRRICDVIRGTVRIHPTSSVSVCKVFEEKFPRFNDLRLSVEKQRNWMQCLLYICTEVTSFTEWALSLAIRKMLDNDISIVKLEEDNPEKMTKAQLNLDRFAKVLDAQMMLLFEYLKRSMGDSNGQSSNLGVPLMLGIFQTTVLGTYRSKYVQFLFFYLASLHVNLCERWLNVLLTIVYAQDQALEKRLAALSYLASFVARASFLTPLFGIRVVQYLTTFMMEIQETAERHAVQGHYEAPQLRLFIAGVQSICYILCFRMSTFVEDEQAKGELRRLMPAWGFPRTTSEAITPILASPIQPIAYIHRTVAKQFCISIRHEFPGIYSQVRGMVKRAARPNIDREDNAKIDCEVYYPFDPYRLSGSHIFLVDIYQNWDKDDNLDAESTEESDGCQGFEAEEDMATMRARAGSLQPSEASGDSDVDFTDTQTATDRGFIPSVGPSPFLGPRRCSEQFEMSPLCMPMDTMEDADDNFALPAPAAENTVLDSFLKSKAYCS